MYVASTCRDGSVYKRPTRRRLAATDEDGSASGGRCRRGILLITRPTYVDQHLSLKSARKPRNPAACYRTCTLHATARSKHREHARHSPRGNAMQGARGSGRRPGPPASRRVVRARLWILPRRRRAALPALLPAARAWAIQAIHRPATRERKHVLPCCSLVRDFLSRHVGLTYLDQPESIRLI